MSLRRRTALGMPALLGNSWLTGCGGGSGDVVEDGMQVAMRVPLPRLADDTISSPPLVVGPYRGSQPWLFVDTGAATAMAPGQGAWFETPPRPTVAAPSAGFNWGTLGPSHQYVEQHCQWAWANPGGDWINAGRVPQATTSPHFTFAANAAVTGAAPYTADITAGVEMARLDGRWNAYIVRCVGGTRAIASHRQTKYPAAVVNVTYTDGTTAVLRCVACTRLTSGNAYTYLGNSEAVVSGATALEFERAVKPVSKATLKLTITQHTASAATVNGYLANPPMNRAVAQYGLAAGYPLDAGLGANDAILFAHAYQDGSTISDWIHPSAPVNVWSMSSWSPHLFRQGAADASRLPYRYNGAPAPGKWFYKQYTSTVSLVNSSYSGDGFEPLAPGIGALRVVIPGSSAADGASLQTAGSLGADLWAVFDEARIGNLDRVCTRFYVRFASKPGRLSDTKMFRYSGGTASYATRAGKFGPGVHHWTYYGGNNNIGGGNLGWTNRNAFYEVPADAPLGGVVPGCYSYDAIGRNMMWGQNGGLGGAFFPNQWYCVEVDCKLNTFNAAGGSPSDGEMTIYVDGRVAAVHKNWKYRDGPIDPKKTPPTNLPPFRKLGPIGLLLNDYMGGVLPADRDTVMFYTGIVAGTSYIGPMMRSKGKPINLKGNVWSPNREANGTVSLGDFTQLPLNEWLEVAGDASKLDSVIEFPRPPRAGAGAGAGGDASLNIVAAWGGAAWDHVNQRMIVCGGGHSDLVEYATGVYGVTAAKLTFERLINSQPSSALQSWNGTTRRLEPASYGNAGNAPLKTGVPSFQHTYDALVWLPPDTPGAGQVNGGLFIPGPARTVVNLDNGVYQTTNWNSPDIDFQSWAYCMAFVDGNAVYGPHEGWYHFKYDLTARQATTWNASSFGAMNWRGIKSNALLPYSNKLWAWMRERREEVSFSATTIVRVRYGTAIDQAATDWTAYSDPITLTSFDGSHLDFNSLSLADDGTLSSAGVHYDHSLQCLWIQANNVGGMLYKVTGLSGSRWTVQKIAGTGARYAPMRMTYGRFRVATIGGVKLAMRVTSTTDPIQVMRLS